MQVAVDVYGAGPDLSAIEAEATRRGLALSFKGQADHCCPALQEYKVRSSQQYCIAKQGQHLHCAEIWCSRTQMTTSCPISVDLSFC
jgi:hypothetical protein